MRVIQRCSKMGLLLGLLWMCGVHADEDRGLQLGDAAPEFVCLDDQGQLWNSRDHIGKRLLVVYFYPSDFSFCCTRQAQRYRDRMHAFCDLGVEVVGISGDQVEAHRQFQQTHDLNFPLLADVNGDVARQFGVPLRTGGKAIVANANGRPVVNAAGRAIQIPRKVTAARWTFIIGRDGRVLYRESDTAPVRDSQEVLEFLRSLDVR